MDKNQEFFNRFEKVSDVVNAMINGLTNKWAKVSMMSFGHYDSDRKICFGCAATNSLCELLKRPFTEDEIHNSFYRAEVFKCDRNVMQHFENSVNFLRMGDLQAFLSDLCMMSHPSFQDYKHLVKECSEDFDLGLPALYNHFTEKELDYYRKYHAFLVEKGM
jgi:hypothetical protein